MNFNKKLDLKESIFFLSIASWYIIAFSLSLFPNSLNQFFSTEKIDIVTNNLLDIFALIACIIFLLIIFTRKTSIAFKIIGGLLLVYPVMLIIFRIQDMFRFGGFF
jgi:hypothetical protein